MRYRRLLTLLGALAACSPVDSGPPLQSPTADEYAVWSAAVDARFGRHHLRVVVEERTERWPHFLPDPRTESGMRALVHDYVDRNRHRARVNARRLGTRQVRLVPQLGGLAGSAADLVTDGRLTVSRPGFDRGGNRALVAIRYGCGGLCAEGAMLVMERGRDGRWRHTSTVAEAYS